MSKKEASVSVGEPATIRSNPLSIPNKVTQKVAAGSPNIGQPMNSSYENQWMLSEEHRVPARKQFEEPKEDAAKPKDLSKKPKESLEAPRKSQKDMTKAERRLMQEQQRMEKQQRLNAGLPKSAKKAAEIEPKKPVAPAAVQEDKTKKTQKTQKIQENDVPWLLHLDTPKRPDSSTLDLHPAVLTLGLYFSEFKIVGSNARCVAMLETFSKASSLTKHRPPSDATFSRHIQKHLDPQIAYLLSTRPMSLSMRECIRWLKKEMSDIVEEDPPLSDDDARHRLMDRIEHFIRERITMADRLIVQYGLQKIQDGEVILTYGKSSVVESLLLEAKKKGIEFKVIVVDSRPLFEGKHLTRRLVAAGIDCSYHLLSSVYVALRSVTKVLMGAHALLNNGAVYSRIGSAMVAMAASDKQIPVMICCETYKFVNRTQVDSFVMNEIGNPDALVNTKPIYNANHLDQPSSDTSVLTSWREQPNLRLLNLLYDVTPSKYITLVVTEVGLIPCTSAPVIWREYNEEFGKRE
ncbi:hypothetical protein CLU79DRAFT_831811 [Phycomyces nitens]|nr:hypothetical protein CLU79DRAFT_831811 [Phycomyces nitens]